MRLLRSFGTARRLVAFAALLVALAVVAGAATVGRAADNGTVDPTITSVLNDDTTNLVAGTPTPGKNIGYTFTFRNTGTNTLNHIVFNAWISNVQLQLGVKPGTSAVGNALYAKFTTDNPNQAPIVCSNTPTQTLTCTQSQLAAGDSWSLTIIFSTNATPAAGDQLYPN